MYPTPVRHYEPVSARASAGYISVKFIFKPIIFYTIPLNYYYLFESILLYKSKLVAIGITYTLTYGDTCICNRHMDIRHNRYMVDRVLYMFHVYVTEN